MHKFDLASLDFEYKNEHVKTLGLWGSGFSKLQACTRLMHKYRWLSYEIYKVWEFCEQPQKGLCLTTYSLLPTERLGWFDLSIYMSHDPLHWELRGVTGDEAHVLGCMDAARNISTGIYIYNINRNREKQKWEVMHNNFNCIICGRKLHFGRMFAYCEKHRHLTNVALPEFLQNMYVRMN